MNLHTLFILLCVQHVPVASTCEIPKSNPFDQEVHIAALILARGGSKEIKLKNLVKVGGRSLLVRSLDVAITVGFNSVWVSTDHRDIALEVQNVSNKINLHWRSPESATDSASSAFAVWEFLQSKPHISAVALLQCTSPFIRRVYVQQGLALFAQTSIDCVFSASRRHDLRWQRGANGVVTPLNFELTKRPRRQDWDGELIENGMFYIASRKLLSRGVFQNTYCQIVEIPEEHSLQIDSPYHLKLAQFLESYNDN